jgi:membrane protease subunit HflC
MKSAHFPWIRLLVTVVVLTVLGLYALSFQVASTEQAVVVRLGQPVRTIDEPGLYFRWPAPVETVQRFDTRLLFQDLRLAETLTKDRRNVVVPLYAAWRIADALRFLEAVGTWAAADRMMENLVASAKNTVLGNRDFAALVSSEPGAVDLAGIEAEILDRVGPVAREEFGIEVVEVGIRRITLPETTTPAVFERMRAERAQFASAFRAEGRRRAEEIRAQTEAESALVVAEARNAAAQTRAQAEAEAATIFAEVYAQDPELFQFLRRLETLEQVVDERTLLILDGKLPPFDLLQNPPAFSTPAPASVPTPGVEDAR